MSSMYQQGHHIIPKMQRKKINAAFWPELKTLYHIHVYKAQYMRICACTQAHTHTSKHIHAHTYTRAHTHTHT